MPNDPQLTSPDLPAELDRQVEALRLAAESVERLAGALETLPTPNDLLGAHPVTEHLEIVRGYVMSMKERLSWWRDPWRDVADLKALHRSVRGLAAEAGAQHRRYTTLRVLLEGGRLEYHPTDHLDQVRAFLERVIEANGFGDLDVLGTGLWRDAEEVRRLLGPSGSRRDRGGVDPTTTGAGAEFVAGVRDGMREHHDVEGREVDLS